MNNIVLTSPFTAEEMERVNVFKREFKIYFEGFSVIGIKPIEDISVYKFEITNLDFHFESDGTMVVSITSGRPGLLVGKGGRLINHLTEHLNSMGDIKPLKLKLIESDLWKPIK